MGDVAGIGPEITAKALVHLRDRKDFVPVVFGDEKVFAHANKTREVPASMEFVGLTDVGPETMHRGAPSPEAGEAAVKYLTTAIEHAMEGRIDAIVTAPISKQSMHMAGYAWPGHTELLKEKTGAQNVAMMFDGGDYKLVLATIHVRLMEVAGMITKKRVLDTLRLTHDSLVGVYGFDSPSIAVAALNPHAGEGGAFGDEETRCIKPAVEEARTLGIDAHGPYPADTLFYKASRGDWDVVIAMYHDQGLTPYKTLYFERGVNITLGLPFVRTSPDHGTAFDIAWEGTADPRSMIRAIELALDYARRSGK